jgi:hypothetical protein
MSDAERTLAVNRECWNCVAAQFYPTVTGPDAQ